jgi:hypothetical protein
MREELIDAVIEQMKLDIEAGDWTAIAELLNRTHEDVLVAFLSDCGMTKGETSMTEDEYEDTYCYNCGHEHDDPSSGSWPAQGCADYEEPTEGESK